MKHLVSAGLLMCRRGARGVEFLLAHPGGPYFVRRDLGVWTLPKGGVHLGEDPLVAAQREFLEETGFTPQADNFGALGQIKQKSGKLVFAWAFEGDCEPLNLVSNTFSVAWPPRSTTTREFPEVDRAAFFGVAEARIKIMEAQRPFLDRALSWLGERS